jgi:hypothetical protein
VLSWVVAACLGLVVLVSIGLPLLLRGPLLKGIVARASGSLCGSVSIGDGHFGWGVVPALLFQKPFLVAIDDLQVRTHGGDTVLAARTSRLHVIVRRRPWRVVVTNAQFADGQWELAVERPKQPIRLVIALRRLPPDGSRAMCNVMKPPVMPPGQGQVEPVVSAFALTLQNIDIRMSFPLWGLELAATNASGAVEVHKTSEGLGFLFDARNVLSNGGGSLRIGRTGQRATVRLPLDTVSIPRISVNEKDPTNLHLQVAYGRTGKAVLAGQAVFTNVFVPKPRRLPAGMELEAHYSSVGIPLARSPGFEAIGQGLAALDAQARVSLHGPFKALTGTASLDGRGLVTRLKVLPGRTYAAEVRFDHLRTAAILPPSHKGLLGGILNGEVSLRTHLGRPATASTAHLEKLELALERNQRDRWPRRFVVSQSTCRLSTPDALVLLLGRIGVHAGVFRLGSLRLMGRGVRVKGSGQAELAKAPGKGHRQAGRVGGSLAIDVDLGRVLAPGAQVRGKVSLALALAGRAGDLQVAGHARGLPVTWRGESFIPPANFSARVGKDRIAVAPLSIVHVGGGVLSAMASLGPGGTVTARVGVAAYPLGRVPGVARARAPGGGPPLSQVLRGTLEASLMAKGSARRPSLSGFIALDDVSWAGRSLGGGRISFAPRPGGTRFEGSALDGVAVSGTVSIGREISGSARATFSDFCLDPWLPRRAAGLGLRVSGPVEVALPRAGPRLAVAALAIHGVGVYVDASGRLEGSTWAAGVRGRLALGQIAPALRLPVREASGAIALDVRGRGDLVHQTRRLDGSVAIAEPVSIWPAASPAAVSLSPGELRLAGDEIRTERLSISGPGVGATFSGSVRLDWAHLRESGISGALTAAIDAGKLDPWLPGRVQTAGHASFDGTIDGALASPRVSGSASIEGLQVSWPTSPVGRVRLDGIIDIQGKTVLFRPLLARFESGGWLRVGAPDRSARLVVDRRPGWHLRSADLAVTGGKLTTRAPIKGVSVQMLGLDLHLTGPAEGPLLLTGDVQLEHGDYRAPAKAKKAPATARRPPSKLLADLRDRLQLDIQVRANKDAFRVRIPYAPDVIVGFDCHVTSHAAEPEVTGRLRGRGLYSRMLLAIADIFSSRHLRRCDLGPH